MGYRGAPGRALLLIAKGLFQLRYLLGPVDFYGNEVIPAVANLSFVANKA